MEVRENLSQLILWKKQTFQPMQDATHSSTSLLHGQSAHENQRKTTPAKNETLKVENKKEVSDAKSVSRTPSLRSPSSVTDSQRTKIEDRELAKVFHPTPKFLVRPPLYHTSSSTAKLRKQLDKPKARFQIPFPESATSASLLALAVQEEGQVLKMLRLARERVRKKLMERKKPRAKSKELMGDCAALLGDSFLSPRTLSSFRDSYISTLDEMFQVWMNLFYFVVNLRVNLIKVLTAVGTERFEPNVEAEKKVIIQAIECVKFFSKLKLKSLSTMSDEVDLPNSNLTATQIADYEEKTSSSFLNDLDFLEKKAKELLKHVINAKDT